MTKTTASTTTKPLAELVEGDTVYGIGNVTFNEPATITEVKRYNGTFVWAVTAHGGFYPAAVVGANKPCVVAK